MKQISGNCILPFALWGEDPPDHIISSIEIIDNLYIVTGDKIGQMIVWMVDNDGKMSPTWYLLGHSGSIHTISRAMISSKNDRYVVSVTSNREMGLWNCLNGRCVRLDRHINVDHRIIEAYRPSNSKSGLLVCCGHYAGVQVLDSLTLRPLMSLQSRAHPDWVRSVCIFEHKQAGMHVVLGLSISGAITMWTLESLDAIHETKVIFETESKMLLLKCPISISICPTKPRLVMVLASRSMQIYDAASWSLLSEYSTNNSCLMLAWFLNTDTIMLLPKMGRCQLYHVPINCDIDSVGVAQISQLSCLECDDIACEAVLVRDNRLMVAIGSERGTVSWWNEDLLETRTRVSETVAPLSVSTLREKWLELDMASMTKPFQQQYSITCCHCEPSVNSLMLGTSSGDILVMELLHSVAVAIFSKDPLKLPFTVLIGHTKAVLALQYAKTISEKAQPNVKQWLWSGGCDFSVRLWNLDSCACVSVFHCHSGSVTSFLVGPPLGLTRGKHEGHIVSPRKGTDPEQEVLRPINYNTWFGHRLYVSFDDNDGVAFLSLETRKVVLHVSLFCAVEAIGWRRDQIAVVLASVDGCVTVWDLGASSLERREMGQIAEDIMDASTDHVRFNCPPPLLLRLSHLKDRLKHTSLSPLLIHSVLIGRDRSSQILLLDTESLLVLIHKQITDQKAASDGLLQAQMLLSLVNQWGMDSCLDATLERTIGLVRPSRRACYGQMNAKTKTWSFPLRPCDDPIGDSVALLAGVSLCHAINNLADSQIQTTWPRLSAFVGHKEPRCGTVDNRVEVRQVCCLFATSMATTNLPQLLCRTSGTVLDLDHVPLIVEVLLHKYHDRCLEIREAARTLLHAAMDSFSSDQRHVLVQFWALHGRISSKSLRPDVDLEPPRDTDSSKARRSLSSVLESPSICDWRFWATISEQEKPMEIEQLQTTALAFLGVVGCRYGSPDLQLTSTSKAVSATILRPQPLDKAILGYGLDDYRLARTTCGHLMAMLTTTDHRQTNHWSSMRCLAITLLGQGFPVWEPYLEVSALFTKLLEIVAPAEKVLAGWHQGQLLTDEMDAVRSARQSLLVIALARPKVFATVLSVEVLRHQMQASSSPVSSNVTAVNGTSSARPGTVSGGGHGQPALLVARHEVIEVIRVLCERKTREIHEVLPEIMDVLLACLSKLDLRQYDLQQLFPPILLYRIASSHTASGKVCVGTRSGHVSFYDVKIGKYNTSPGHGAAVTSVTFSPDGKQMASYSMPDNTVCIWQLFSSGLFGMGSSHQVKMASRLNVPPVAVSDSVTEEDSSLLLWLEWFENKSIHLVTSAGLVNKIKL